MQGTVRTQNVFLDRRCNWAAALYGALLIAAFAPTLVELFREWIERPEYGHGLLMPPAAAWLIWRRRHELAKLKRRESLADAGLGLLAAFALIPVLGLLLLGEMKLAWALKPYAFVASLAAGVGLFYGRRGLRELAAPLLVLLLMCPMPFRVHTLLTLPLKRHAAVLATGLLDLCGLEAGLEGNIIHVPSIDALWIADACSGIRSLISLVSVAVLGCILWRRHWSIKLLVIASCVPLAVVVNGVRIWGTGMLSVHVSPKIAQGFFHLFEGFLLFGVAAALLWCWAILLDRVLPRRPDPAAEAAPSAPLEPAAPFPWLRRFSLAVAGLALLASVWGVYRIRSRLATSGFDPVLAARMEASLQGLPRVPANGAYTGDPIDWSDEVIENSGADVYGAMQYRVKDNRLFLVFLGGVCRYNQNFHTPSVCMPAGGWEALETTEVALNADGGRPMQRLLLQRGSQQMLVYFWFRAGDKTAASEWWARISRIPDLLGGKRLPTTFICSIYVPIQGGIEESERAALEFLNTMDPYFDEATASGGLHG